MRQLIDYARDGGVYYDAKEIELMCEVVAAARGLRMPGQSDYYEWIKTMFKFRKSLLALDEYREGKENENDK